MLEGGHTLCYRCVVCGNLFFKRAISPSRSRSRACSWASSLSSALTRRFQCAFLLAKNRTVFLRLLTAVLASRHCVFQASRLLAKNRTSLLCGLLSCLSWPAAMASAVDVTSWFLGEGVMGYPYSRCVHELGYRCTYFTQKRTHTQ